MTAQYVNTLDVFEYLRSVNEVPNYPDTTTPEVVDETGSLGVGSAIFLDNKNIIDNTLTLSYGPNNIDTTDLTEDTDYTINLDKGKIIIASTAIGTDNVYAEYKSSLLTSDSDMLNRIQRASKDIEEETSNQYGTLTLVTREEQSGRGNFDKIYIPRNNRVNVIKTQLTSDITAIATSIEVDSTTGLVADDIISIGAEAMTISSVDNTTTLTVTRGSLDTTATTHSDNDWIINFFVETSSSSQGSVPTYSPRTFRSDYDVDSKTGEVQLMHTDNNVLDELAIGNFPNNTIFNRIRLTYKYGTSSVPSDIQRLCILKAAYDLTLSGIAKALPDGRDGFNPTAQRSILDEINRIIKDNQSYIIDGI